jgi:hypothetical protein
LDIFFSNLQISEYKEFTSIFCIFETAIGAKHLSDRVLRIPRGSSPW